MKKIFSMLFLSTLLFLLFSGSSYAQLTGSKNIPGDYASVSLAITDLNTQGVGAGGVTFNIAAGYTDTASNLTITATGTSSNPIIFQKSGAGANPLLTAGVGTSTTLDGIIRLSGTDYITFDGIDLLENVLNTTTTTMMEWGFALLKVSVTDGCRYVTIKNCNITLNKTNLNAVGIYSANHTATSTSSLVLTDTLGSNSYNKFLSNTISNVNSGITITGYITATPYILYDQNNEVGSTGVLQNRIFNYGSTSTAYGVYGIYQNNIKVYNTNINNSGGASATSTLYGIFLSTGINSSADIYGDTVTVASSGTTSQQTAISNAMGGTGTSNTVNIYDNVIQNSSYTTATSALCYYIYNSASCFNLNVYGNKILNNTYGGTSTATGTTGYIYTFGGTATSNIWQIYNNVISGNSRVQSALGTGTVYGLYNSSSGPTMNIFGNLISDNSFMSTSIAYIIYPSSSIMTSLNVYDNIIRNITRPNLSSGSVYNIYHTAGASGTANIYGNSISNITITGSGTIYGIYSSAANMNKNIYRDTIYNLSSAGGSVYGLYSGSGMTSEIYRNRVYGLATTTGTVYGGYITGGTVNYFHNNYISDLKSIDAASAISIAGLYFSGGTNDYAFFNTIYLNAVSSSATIFGVAGIYVSTTPIVDLRNNIVVNLSTPGPTGGFVSAYMRNSSTLTTYAAESNNNVLYAGTPSANKLIYNDGTNQLQTVAAFKTLVSPRDNNSFSENPPFVNVSASPYDLHISAVQPTGVESSGIPVTLPVAITTDYDNDSRNILNPDIGADEGAFIFGDFAPPSISYTPLSHTTSTTDRSLTASITDNIVVESTPPNDPRIYYKKGINGEFKYRNKTSSAGNDYTFDIVVDSVGGLIMGDTVFYYVAAQDLGTPPSLPNCGTNPGGGSGVNPPGTTAPTSVNRYIVVDMPMTGVYTVGLSLFNKLSGKNLVSVKKTRTIIKEIPIYDETSGKDEKLNGKKSDRSDITSPVQNITGYKDENVKTQKVEVTEEYYELTENGRTYKGFDFSEITKEDLFKNGIVYNGTDQLAGIYPSITAALGDMTNRGIQGPVTFMLIDANYPSETYPLMINSIGGSSSVNTITIKPAAGVSPLISGSQNSGGLFRIINTNYVTIDGSNTVSGTTRDLSIFNEATTGPSVILVGSLGTTPITNVTVKNCNIRNGVNTSSAVVISDGTLSGTAGYFSNITIQNNLIQRAYMGIYTQGGTVPQNGSSVSYIGNSLDSAGIYSIRYIGMYMQGVNGGLISQNQIGNFDGATSEDDKGMWLATGSTNINVERNKIYNLNYLGTGGYGAHGVYVTTTLTDAGISIRNNMISNLSGDGYSYTSIPTDNIIGIALPSAQSGINIYHNSIHLSGNTLNKTSAMSMGIYLGTGVIADIRGNVIVNNLGLLDATGYGSCGIYAVTSNAQFLNLDYNDYYINPSGSGLKIIGQIAAVPNASLAEWMLATGKDANSVTGNPQFISLNDLHINATVPSMVESRCFPIGGITTDFDGETRNIATPDIGADEGDFIYSLNVPATPALVSPLNNAVGQSLSLTFVWNKSEIALSYRIQISTDSLFTNLIVDDSTLTDSTRLVSGLAPLTYYWWRVNAKNTGGTSGYSTVFKFRTIGTPTQITLLNPPNDATGQPVSINFRWSRATDQMSPFSSVKKTSMKTGTIEKSDRDAVSNYWWELTTDTVSFANLQRDTTLTDTTVTASVSYSTTYFWRAKAKNQVGWGVFAAWYKFTTSPLPPAVVNLTVIPGGFYNTGTNQLNMKDSITVYLVDSVTCLKVDSSKGVVDSVSFGMPLSFSNAPTGNYYMIVYHRNHLGIATMFRQNVVRGSTVSYDFTTDSSKAFGFNMIKVSTSPVRWAMIPGDANRDGFIDALDQSIWIAENGLDGYLASDFNGDVFVDALDQAIWIAYNGLGSFLPCGFTLDPGTQSLMLNAPNYDVKKTNRIMLERKKQDDQIKKGNGNVQDKNNNRK